MITVINGLTEIEKFKENKRMTYTRVLRAVADIECMQCMQLNKFWSGLYDEAGSMSEKM